MERDPSAARRQQCRRRGTEAGIERGARLRGASLRCAARAFLSVSILLAGCAAVPDVPVPWNPTLNDRVFLAAGGFYSEMSSEARLDSAFLGLGATLDLEGSLDLDSNVVVPFGAAHVRLDDRWRLEVEYYRIERESTKTLDIEVQWGDQVFPVDTGLDSRLDLSMMRVSLGYAFFRRVDKELGIALGVHAARVEAVLEDENGVGDEGELLAPLPVGSLYGAIALTERWSILMRVDAFSLEYEGYSGRILSNGVDLVYQPFRHLGIGLGFRDLYVDLESDDSDYRGKIESDVRGPIGFVNVTF